MQIAEMIFQTRSKPP
ncbi:MAG: hypothetical protein ACLT0H_10325 [Lachnospiraceae bacterium]